MQIELSNREFRRLLDLVYVGNWIMNSTRGDDRILEYDEIESKIFSHCMKNKMTSLMEVVDGEVVPSARFAEGGIHEAIMDYEDTVFYEILAEELARRDMAAEQVSQDDAEELSARMEEYFTEFEKNGIDNMKILP